MLQAISEWAPFRIDALGIVTMLGSDEVNRTSGRLVPNRFVEYLPMLGAFVMASNQFTQAIQDNVIYNITDGIMATDVTGWLSRWLLEQDPSWCITTYHWEVRSVDVSIWQTTAPALVIGIIVNAGLLALTLVIRDWFGFANALSMTLSVLVRSYLVGENRRSLDKAAANFSKKEAEIVKIFCVLSNGKAVTLLAPRGIVIRCFLTTPQPLQPRIYGFVRAIGWLAFACHVVSIGQSTLFIQMISVVVLLGATVLFILGIGAEDYLVSRRISITRSDLLDLEDRRTTAYARLAMTDDEESAMLAWSLMPQRTNSAWWVKYHKLRDGIHSAKSVVAGQKSKVLPLHRFHQ